MTTLANGADLPPIHAKDLEGNDIDIAGTIGGKWTAVLLYRGHW